ncbi:MAG TPA: hypothetical protein VFQ53_03695 [Kofleriaceae bacterium]|nr:hypothetical protein [Kofleriaceae bacterium]
MKRALCLLAIAACTDTTTPIEVDVPDVGEVSRSFAVDGTREVQLHVAGPVVVEAWAEGGAIDGVPDAQLAAGASASWLVPHAIDGDTSFVVRGNGDVVLTVAGRGAAVPAIARGRSLAWLDDATLDDPATISFARVMATIAADGHGGTLLERWFTAFAAGPGAGRASFAQFLDELRAAQGRDPTAWDLAPLPFRVTGIHNRIDLAKDGHCGELRVSIASTHPTFSPVHFIFLFRQPAADDDVTPDGVVHCRGTARRWAQLTALDDASFHAAARDWLATGLIRDRFLLAESVELSISPWQWRQWLPSGDAFTNPPLFQTIDVARLNAPGATRDAFLADVAANADAIATRTWPVPASFRSAVAEVQPNAKAELVDLAGSPALARYPELPRMLGMIGCPRCHTDNADFIQTGVDRKPSPFYDRELDARKLRLDALDTGDWPAAVPFGPLQPL